MKRFIISLISTFTLLLAFSCARMEELANMKVYADDDPVTCDFTLEVENPLVETKATYMPSTLNKITNVNVWIYRDGALLSDYSFYKSDYASDPHLPMMFPSASASYNVYLFANVGQKTAPANETNIGTVSFSVNDYSSFIYNGFPMANSVLNYTPSGGQSISIKRLVGVYNISLAQSSDKITWEVTGGRVCNVPKVVRPFGTLEGFEGYASKIENASEKLSSGDLLSSGDISSLNGGGSVTLYYLENCQGQLLPGNTDYRLKKLDAPEFSGIKDFCTYLQLDCSAVTPTATYSNIHYNFYLGEDATTDFSVRRSTQHAFSLELSSDIISPEEEWFIEPEEPDIKNTLVLCTSLGTPVSPGYGWDAYDNRTCPSCGEKWGYNYILKKAGDYYQPYCYSCGYTGDLRSVVPMTNSKFYLFDNIIARFYVLTDIPYSYSTDSYFNWSAYIKSSGTDTGNGFSVTRTELGKRGYELTVSNANTVELGKSNITDTLVISSYDNLIVKEIPLIAICSPIQISWVPYSDNFNMSAHCSGMEDDEFPYIIRASMNNFKMRVKRTLGGITQAAVETTGGVNLYSINLNDSPSITGFVMPTSSTYKAYSGDSSSGTTYGSKYYSSGFSRATTQASFNGWTKLNESNASEYFATGYMTANISFSRDYPQAPYYFSSGTTIPAHFNYTTKNTFSMNDAQAFNYENEWYIPTYVPASCYTNSSCTGSKAIRSVRCRFTVQNSVNSDGTLSL